MRTSPSTHSFWSMRTVNLNLVAFSIKGHKKWDTHDMVPMGMRQKNVSSALAFSEFPFQQMVAQNPETRSAVKNHMLATHLQVDAGRISSIATFQIIGKTVNKCFTRGRILEVGRTEPSPASRGRPAPPSGWAGSPGHHKM
jgi:hypothetical protein